MKGDKLYLVNILECIQQIESYTQGGREAFQHTRMIQDAVIRNFEIMGEATKRISTDLREAYPDVRWHDVAGFRDVLIHDYLGVDLDEVWSILQLDMPLLKRQIAEILEALEGRA